MRPDKMTFLFSSAQNIISVSFFFFFTAIIYLLAISANM